MRQRRGSPLKDRTFLSPSTVANSFAGLASVVFQNLGCYSDKFALVIRLATMNNRHGEEPGQQHTADLKQDHRKKFPQTEERQEAHRTPSRQDEKNKLFIVYCS